MKLVSGSKSMDTSDRAAVVAILNVTPDSYYDGGKNVALPHLLQNAKSAMEHGADILEIGGESTGPGSVHVSLQTELDRVLPVVRAIRAALPLAWISIDTTKASVAEAALNSGADMINDISAGRADPKMFSVIASMGCPYVLMFSKDPTPRTTKSDQQYDDVIATIRSFLVERISRARAAGITSGQIILDPGLGHFISSNPRYSFEILRRLRELADLGPVFISPSRKSFLAGPKNVPAKERLSATLAATAIAILHGATYIRTHDPKETREVTEVVQAMMS